MEDAELEECLDAIKDKIRRWVLLKPTELESWITRKPKEDILRELKTPYELPHPEATAMLPYMIHMDYVLSIKFLRTLWWLEAGL